MAKRTGSEMEKLRNEIQELKLSNLELSDKLKAAVALIKHYGLSEDGGDRVGRKIKRKGLDMFDEACPNCGESLNIDVLVLVNGFEKEIISCPKCSYIKRPEKR